MSEGGVARPPHTQRLEDDQARAARYAEARAFFDGYQWPTRARRGERRWTFNYAAALVIKTASYALSDPVRFNVTGSDSDTADVEQLLADVLNAQDAHQLDHATLVEASVIGDAVTKVTWSNELNYPQLVQVDPAAIITTINPTKPQEALAVSHAYELSGAAILENLDHPPQDLDPRRTYTVTEHWTQDLWTVLINNAPHSQMPNPYGWVPYVFLHNARNPRDFWGRSDLEPLYDVCRALNQRLTVLDTILELSGAPVTVLENVEGSEGIRIFPGAKWELPEGSKAYLLSLLESSGMDLHIKTIDLLYRAMHDLAETPRTAFGDTGRPLSGAALEVEIQPLVQRVNRKRAAMAAYYRARNARILELLERFGSAPIGGLRLTEPIWPPVLPSDTSQDVRDVVQLTGAKIISRRTAAERVGISDPDAEMATIDQETRPTPQTDALRSPRIDASDPPPVIRPEQEGP